MTTPRSKSKRASSAASKAAAAARPFQAHLLVPPHELLGEEEGLRTLKELGTNSERLPKILVTDPGLKTDPKFVTAREAREPLNGRVVRIRRPSATAGKAVAYRILVQSLGE